MVERECDIRKRKMQEKREREVWGENDRTSDGEEKEAKNEGEIQKKTGTKKDIQVEKYRERERGKDRKAEGERRERDIT